MAVAIPLGLFALFGLWAVTAAKNSRENFRRAISNPESVEVLVGRVAEIERVMTAPTATKQFRSSTSWTYQSINIDGHIFKLGAGTSNPGFRHYDYFSPPISQGDQIRIKHYRGRAIEIEKTC